MILKAGKANAVNHFNRLQLFLDVIWGKVYFYVDQISTVKYQCFNRLVVVALAVWSANFLEAQILYWDSNGAIPGAGVAPSGTWGTDPFWSTSSLGDIATGSYVSGTDVVFSAGSDAVNPYTITLDNTQVANSVAFKDGTPTLTGGVLLQIGGGGINVTTSDPTGVTIASNVELLADQIWTITNGTSLVDSGTIRGALQLTKAGRGTLLLSGSNTFSGGLIIREGIVNGTTSSSVFGTGGITLGDSSGNSNATLNSGFGGTIANTISVAAGNTGTATIQSSANTTFSGAVTLDSHDLYLLTTNNTLALSGGITGRGNLILQSGSSSITLSTSSVNINGTITNSGTGNAPSIISAPVGSNVTAITENSTTSGLTISGQLQVNSGGTTLSNNNPSGLSVLSLSGGVAGTGDLRLNNNGSIYNGIILSGFTVNNSGTIINSGTGLGTTLISATVGPNVTAITQDTAKSEFFVNGTLILNSGDKTLTNTSAATAFSKVTFGGGSTGTGNILLYNNSTLADGITFQGSTINHIGTVINAGAGTGSVRLASALGAYVTSVIQNSATSQLTLAGASIGYLGDIEINAGIVSSSTFANALGNGTIKLGATNGNANATLNGGYNGTHINPITVTGGNSGVATITSSANSTFSGPVTLDSHDLRLSPSGYNLTLSGGITGAGNLTLRTTGPGVITLSTSSIDNAGTIINSGTGNGGSVISAPVESNVAAITENSTTSGLTISGTLRVNSNGTSLSNNNVSGSSLFTLTGGIIGDGDLLLANNSAITNGITISSGGVNNSGVIINSGLGTGAALISSSIGSNVTDIIQNSTTSPLTLGGLNSFSGDLKINAGTVNSITSSGAFGIGTIFLGDTSGNANITLNSGVADNHPNPISVTAGNTGIATISSTANATFSGLVTLNSHDLRLMPSNFNNLTLSGGTTGSGNLTLNPTSGNVVALSGGSVNHIGIIKNSGSGNGSSVISAPVGANVTEIRQESATASLTISGALTVNNSVTTLINNNASGSALLTLSGGTAGAGNLQLNNNSAINNGITLSGGSISHNGTLSNSGTGTGGTLISAVIDDNIAGVIQNSTTSSLTLSGANTYSRPTTVNAGLLKAGIASVANVSGAFGNNSTVTLANVAGAGLDIAGFNTQIGSLAGGGLSGGNVSLGGATLTTGGDNTDTTYGGAISGLGAFVKIGTGKQILTGANTYGGTTTVNAGILVINGNNIAATGVVTVASGATLGGSGVVGGETIINGIHSPGNSPGLQTFVNGLTYNDGAMVNWELATNSTGARGVDYDGIDVTNGALTVNGTVHLNLVFNSSGSSVAWSNSFWSMDHQWTFYDVSATRNGTFVLGNVGGDSQGATLESIHPGASFGISYSGNDVIISYAAVPEPDFLGLALAAGLALLVFSRRRP